MNKIILVLLCLFSFTVTFAKDVKCADAASASIRKEPVKDGDSDGDVVIIPGQGKPAK